MKPNRLSLSIVIHQQAAIAKNLLEDITDLCDDLDAEILLTVNVDERLPYDDLAFHHPLKIIHNKTPNGFGSNHNQAFRQSRGRYFAILNPDIRLLGNPFDQLIQCLDRTRAGVVSPRIVNPSGGVENSARRFPTPVGILKKAIRRSSKLDYQAADEWFRADWVGGMFMVFSRDNFSRIGGFDERYFLYYEDVDLCARLQLIGKEVVVCPNVQALHDARWESHHNPRYRRWHIQSMLRYFLSRGFWQLVVARYLRG